MQLMLYSVAGLYPSSPATGVKRYVDDLIFFNQKTQYYAVMLVRRVILLEYLKV